MIKIFFYQISNESSNFKIKIKLQAKQKKKNQNTIFFEKKNIYNQIEIILINSFILWKSDKKK